jgi:hypothetical protein
MDCSKARARAKASAANLGAAFGLAFASGAGMIHGIDLPMARSLAFQPRAAAVLLLGAVWLWSVAPARAIILDSTDDPTANTTAPDDPDAAGGWDYEGQFDGYLGTPIAADYFITAAHIGGSVGDTITYQGDTYTTTAVSTDPDTDLRIWKVSGDFPDYAPLFTTPGGEVGQTLYVFGRGTQRGSAVTVNGSLAGWQWGTYDDVQRWGQNVVDSIQQGFLVANFDSPANGGLANEATLSAGDSGGGVFIKQNGMWSLAGINYGVTSPYSLSPDGSNPFDAAIFAQDGLYSPDDDNVYVPVTGPGSFYSTEIAGRLSYIDSVIGVPEPSSAALGGLWGGGFLLFWAWAFRRRRVQ